MNSYPSFSDLRDELYLKFEREGELVKPSHWQGRDISNRHDMQTYEVLNVSATVWLPDEDLAGYRADIRPDIPWADDHFEERVCGYPLNPGLQWAKWRMGKGADDFRRPDGRFDHNYMERYWPKFARKVPPAEVPPSPSPIETLDPSLAHFGIDRRYGDLMDLVDLMVREPLTRQAYLPIWFPEDTGLVHRGRAPCSLGYHFILRHSELHCVYYLRSCDLINHWANDMYFTVRLMIWLLGRLREKDRETWEDIPLGTLTTHTTSLHCFRANWHEVLQHNQRRLKS